MESGAEGKGKVVIPNGVAFYHQHWLVVQKSSTSAKSIKDTSTRIVLMDYSATEVMQDLQYVCRLFSLKYFLVHLEYVFTFKV